MLQQWGGKIPMPLNGAAYKSQCRIHTPSKLLYVRSPRADKSPPTFFPSFFSFFFLREPLIYLAVQTSPWIFARLVLKNLRFPLDSHTHTHTTLLLFYLAEHFSADDTAVYTTFNSMQSTSFFCMNTCPTISLATPSFVLQFPNSITSPILKKACSLIVLL